MQPDVPDAADEALVHLFFALGGEACAEEVEGIGEGGGGGAGEGAGDEAFDVGGGLEGGGEGLQGEGGGAVDAELEGAVEDVEEFGGDVAFPEGLDGGLIRANEW